MVGAVNIRHGVAKCLYRGEEAEMIRGLFLLTMKPVTYAANVAEDDLADQGASNSHVAALRAKAAEEGRQVVIVSAQVPVPPCDHVRLSFMPHAFSFPIG